MSFTDLPVVVQFGYSTMLKASNFNIAILQAIIFTPNFSEFSVPKALATILGKYAQRYDGSVQALPLPEEIPPEVPRVILQSKEGTYRLEVSPKRINSYWIRASETQVDLEDIASSGIEVLEHYVQSMETQVSRMALVLTRVCKAENPAQLLIEKFCKAEVQNTLFNQSQNFEIHNHKCLQLKNFSVNCWIRCKTEVLLIDNSQNSAVIVEQDLNTLAEEIEQRRFKTSEIQSYFQVALAEAETIMQVYFANEG